MTRTVRGSNGQKMRAMSEPEVAYASLSLSLFLSPRSLFFVLCFLLSIFAFLP